MSWADLLFSFEGKIGRADYWLGVLICVILSVIAGALSAPQLIDGPMLIAAIAVYALGAWIWFAVGIKRCHGRGKSGWWMLLSMLPLIGLLWAIIDLGILGDAPDQGGEIARA